VITQIALVAPVGLEMDILEEKGDNLNWSKT
jgi:hypothetical protein